MDSSFWFDTIRLVWTIVYIEGFRAIISKKNDISLNIVFVSANSEDPDEMSHHAAFIWVFTVCQSLGITGI